jgi:isopenicillin N synthase-like dioxygenase
MVPGPTPPCPASIIHHRLILRDKGFFYVTNHGLTATQINRQYAIAKALFALPLDEKLKYICDTASGDFRGYKPQSTGKLSGRDNDERYNIPKFTPEHERAHPQVIRDHYGEIREFSLHIHNNVLLPLLRLFAYVLEIDDEEALANLHRYDEPGLEYLRYMIYHPRPAADDAAVGNIWAKGHTDYNTLTFLFYQPVAGLQVLSPDGVWRYVRSEPDAIIVNIADALEYLSGGFLKSTVHRVVRPPGDQVSESRLGLIYFARPEARVAMRPLESPVVERVGSRLDGKYVRALEGVTAEGECFLFRSCFVGEVEGRLMTGLIRMGEGTDCKGPSVPDRACRPAREGDYCGGAAAVL